MSDDDFTDRWLLLAAAARQIPEPPLPALDVQRIVAVRRRPPPPLRIGWLPPGLAAAAMVAAAVSWWGGLDPGPMARDTGGFLADLPRQVPHAPNLPAPALPSAGGLMTALLDQSRRFIPDSAESAP